MGNFLMIKEHVGIFLTVIIATPVIFLFTIFLCENMAKFVIPDSIMFPSAMFLFSIANMLLTAFLTFKAIRNHAILIANTKICEYEYKIAENINLLRFHINEDPEVWLKKHRLTKEEFSYLLASFSLSSSLYRTSPFGKDLVQPGSYRDRMFKTKAMQDAWPAIKPLLGNKDFIEKMDNLYRLYRE